MQQKCLDQRSPTWIQSRQGMTMYRRPYRRMSKVYLLCLLKTRYRGIVCLLAVAVGCMILVQVKPRARGFGDVDGGSGGDTVNLINILKAINGGTSPLLILYWTAVFEKRDWGFGGHLQHCPHLKNKCIFSADRSLYRIADVMLLHMRDPFWVPKYRPPRQKWAFSLMESPVYTGLNLREIRWLFNITMTYKRSSNIPWVYGRYVPLANKTIKTMLLAKHRRTNYAAGKKHLAAWFSSHCHPQSKRDEYVEDLLSHFDVHVYGSCGGNYSCPKDAAERCLEQVNREYKFMFAFENSLCEDYVTEKVWQIMQRQINVVPVVMGYSKYAELLPPHSFVDASDFSSPKVLAEHLKRVAADDVLYNEYFRWRTTHTCSDPGLSMGCQVCDYMLRHRNETQTLNIEQFWSVETNCVDPKQFNARW